MELNQGVFDRYAHYYDLLYKDKDYAGEANFANECLLGAGAVPGMLVELGCGTGRHAINFAQLGWQVRGIDLSDKMVARAENRAAEQPNALRQKLSFGVGDIRDLRLPETFEAAVSLFHVLSYQTSDRELRSALESVGTLLKAGGLFLFDFWHGPGVLADPPEVRVKRLEDDIISVTRIAEPQHLPSENTVIVDYQLFIREKVSGLIEDVRESHRMRYLFLPEIERMLHDAGFTLVRSGRWGTPEKLGSDAWYGYVVARKS